MKSLNKFLIRQPSRKDFAEIVTQSLLEAGVSAVHFNEDDYSLKIGHGDKAALLLSNSYAEYCRAPRSKRRTVIERLTAAYVSTPDIPEDFASLQQNLIPMIRETAFFEIGDLQLQARGMNPSRLRTITGPVVDTLVVSLAYDTEHSIMQVSEETFNEWHVTFDEAVKRAKDNLRDKTDPKGFTEFAPGVYLGQWGDSNDSARILLTDFIYRLPVYGDPVAFVPNRSELWVTGKNNSAGLDVILKEGEKSCFEPYSVSPYLYLLNDGVWETYLPDDPKQRKQALSIQRRREGINYNEQKQSLDRVHELDGTETFVASYSIQTYKDGTDHSICVWGKDIDSLLPKTETIALLTDEDSKDFIFVNWDAAVQIVGDLMEVEPGLVPTRYHVRDFPSEHQITQLRAVDLLAKALAPQ